MQRWTFVVGLASLSLFLSACSSDDASGSGAGGSTASGGSGDPGSGGSPGSGGAGPPGTGGAPTNSNSLGEGTASLDGNRLTASIALRDVPQSDEDHVCVVVHLPNTERVWATDIFATLTGGSHHLIVDREAAGEPEQLSAQSCFPTMASDSTRLIIAQTEETQVTLPAGTAFPLEPRQPLFLQLHYFNPTGEPQDISGTVEIEFEEDSASPPIEAKSLFTGSMSISIPAHGPGSAESFVIPTPSTGERHVFALTSHTHQLGVHATIERVASADAPDTTPIHESLDWEEPPLTVFSPPLVFDGSDGIRLICNYQNDTDQTVTFGTGVDAEMCFMWIYYFDR